MAFESFSHCVSCCIRSHKIIARPLLDSDFFIDISASLIHKPAFCDTANNLKKFVLFFSFGA